VAVARGAADTGHLPGGAGPQRRSRGTLHQHITGTEGLVPHRKRGRQRGRPPPGTGPARLPAGEAMAAERADAFSHHHQALDRVAPAWWAPPGRTTASSRRWSMSGAGWWGSNGTPRRPPRRPQAAGHLRRLRRPGPGPLKAGHGPEAPRPAPVSRLASSACRPGWSRPAATVPTPAEGADRSARPDQGVRAGTGRAGKGSQPSSANRSVMPQPHHEPSFADPPRPPGLRPAGASPATRSVPGDCAASGAPCNGAGPGPGSNGLGPTGARPFDGLPAVAHRHHFRECALSATGNRPKQWAQRAAAEPFRAHRGNVVRRVVLVLAVVLGGFWLVGR